MANRNVSQKTSSISNDNQKSGAFKKLMMTSALTAAGFIGIVGIAEAGTSTPTDGTTVYGSSTTTKSGDTYTTNQGSNIAISEYQYSLLLDGHETWNINQPGAGSLSAHRILTMDNDPSRILGILNSNGRVLIIDPNGVFFGPGSRVDVAGIITTTGDIDNAQIIGNEFGDYTIENIDTGAIDLQGQISVSEAGLAAFVAPTVKNAGIIKAKMGKIVMASGEKVTLDLYGDNLVEIEVAGGAESLVENTGEILAEGGEIHMTAAAAKEAVDNIINVDGIVSASSASMQGGKIVLGGGDSGTVKVAGKVDVSGEGAGKVEVKGQNITVTETAELTADGGENGDGGEVVIIADDKAIFRGKASAKGGTSNGKGGFVETSGLGYIDITGGEVDTRAADGTAGTWLIDPTDITILGIGSSDPIVISGDTSTIYWTQIAQALGSNNVIISTAGSGSGLGDITFAESTTVVGFSGTENRTLDFVADNNIIVNGNIVLSNIGTTTLDAAGDVIFNSSFVTSDNLMSPVTSGNLNVIASNDIFVNAGAVVGATLGNANVTLTAGNANGGNSAIEIDGMVRADMGKITLNADNYFVEVNATGQIFSNGDLEVNSNHGFDVDKNGLINLHAGDAYINAPIVQLGADINTTGTITGTATTVKVENIDAEIQDGIDVAASGGTVTVSDGTYVENITINKALSLLSENGRGSTTIQGISGVGALGTVVFKPSTSGVQLGDAGKGFTIVGIDNGSAGIENAAVYLQGAQSNHLIKGNDIVANGDAGLLSEYGATVSGITIDGNIFSGQTFTGANPAGNGFGSQFTLNNVPRQLVTMGGGTGGGNTSNITFSNNEITGTAGGLNTSGEEQGNTLVTIDADNSNITGNTFAGTTARYGTSLRARGDGTLISGNTFNAAGLTDSTGHLYVTNNVYTGIAGQDNIIDIWNSNTFVGRATVSSDDINASADGIGVTVGGAVAASNAGATVFINEATYNEGDINIDKNLLISGAGKGKTVIDATGFSNGFIINSDLGNTNTTIRRLSVNNASDAGVEVTNSGALKVLTLNQTSFADNGNNGVAVYGTGVKETRILNSDFLDNGNNNSGNLGRGDVLFYGYNGDITLTNVTIEGNTDDFDYGGWKGVAPRASYGVQVYGTGTDASGEINLDNVKISGNYRAALLGIQKYDGADITLNDVVLGGQTSDGTDSAVTFGSLYLSELNDTVDIGNTSFLAIDDNTPSVAGQYIAVGVEAGSPTVIATNASFEGVVGNTATLAQSFAIEDKVEHDMDRNDHGFTGHVIWQNANEYFVTENNLGIQRAVDLASTGGLINVNSGTYTENVNINKDGLSILGAQSGVDARRRYGAIETILEGYIKTGTIDGLTIDGFRIENQGDDVAGYGGKGSINLGNNASNVTIKNTIIDGNGQVGHGIVTSSAGASDIRIEKNLFTDNSYGVYVNSNDDNVVIVSNRFDGNRYGVITQDGGANTKVNGNTFINNTRAGVLAWSANGAPSTIGTMNNNQFRNNEQHIGHWDGNGADISIEADTGNKFYINGAYKLVSEMTTEELFALEDAITHVMDDASFGRVVFGGGDLFVTSNTLGIQNAINLANAGATVNVDGSTYTEDLVIDKALKLTGHGTTLQSAGGESLITVTAADVNIDPITFDGLGLADYGINATGLGADNIVVDGNTFKGFNKAGIYLATPTGATTGTIINNTFEGSSTVGIQTGTLNNGYALTIKDNTIGSDGDEVKNGIVFGRISSAQVNVTNGTIHSNNDGISISEGTHSGADVNIKNAKVYSKNDEAIDFQKTIHAGSTVDITGSSSRFVGGGNGIEFSGINGDVTLNDGNIAGLGSDKRGVNLLGAIKGNLTLDEVGIYGDDDAIGSNDTQANTIDGGSVIINGGFVLSNKGDGIEFGTIKNGGSFSYTGASFFNEILSEDAGIRFAGNVESGSSVTINTPFISSENNGIVFDGDVKDASSVNITGGLGLFVGDSGIVFNGAVEGGSIVDIDNVKITTSGMTVTNSASTGGFLSGATSSGAASSKGGDAIRFGSIDGASVNIENSKLSASNGNAIIVDGELSGNSTITIADNTVSQALDGSGILIKDARFGGVSAEISGNKIDNTGSDALAVYNLSNVQVLNNKIGTTGGAENIKGDGIYAILSDGIVITGNKVERTDSTASNKGNGIKVVSSDNAVIGGAGAAQNIVNNVKWDGISVIAGNNVTINNNMVTKAQRAGIYAENLTNSAITNNTIDQTTQFRGIGLNGGNFVTVSGNTIDNTALDGIYSRNAQNVTIASNLIGTVGGNIGTNGILVEAANGKTTTLIDNTINNVADHGIAFTGGVNGGKVNIITNAINASKNGIDFDGDLSGGTVEIGVNTINANENGVVFADNIINSNVYFGGNRGNGFGYQVINAGKSGIVFGGDLTNSYVGMPRQQVTALDGDAVRFEGGLSGTRVGVGYGEGEYINLAPVWVSNVGGFFTGSDNGVVFAGNVTSGSLIEVNSTEITGQDGDGVRFGGDVDGSDVLVSSANIKGLNGSGIVVAGHVANGSAFEISNAETSDTPKFGPNSYGAGSGNTISGTTNGIEFKGIDGSTVTIANNASITGGSNGILFGAGSPSVLNSDVVIDNNALIEGGNGIKFGDSITQASSVSITNNDLINGKAGDGILFANKVDANNGTEQELYIADNTMIRGSFSGIRSTQFTGWFQHPGHDTLIKNNTIEGLGDAGINIGGSISGARVRIVSNDIEGRNDGIRLDGNVRDNGILAINKNTSINGRFDDGVDVGGAANGGMIRIAQNDSITGRGNGIEANGTFDGGTLNINSNSYIYGLGDGVHVEGVLTGNSKIIVKDNTDIQSGFGDGVEVRDTGLSSFGTDVRVVGNTISNVGSHGVNLYRVSGATVSGNTVSEAGRDGIHVERSWFTTIHGNQISRVLGDGIELSGSNFASIRRNIVLLAAGNGILLNDSEASVIARNLVALVGDDGIDVEDSSFTRIVQNFIGLTGDDGIEVENSNYVDIKRNLIALVSDDGIDVDNSFGADIERNIIFLAGDNGIEVEDSNNADILNNRIGLVGGNGILVGGSNNAEIERNRIQLTGENGIAVFGGSNNSATNNRVRNVAGNGIAFFGVNGFDISGNRVRDAYNGINVVASNDGTIQGNVANRNRNTGIRVDSSNTFTISGNTANRNDIGLGIYGSSNGLVDANTFNNNRDYGIHLGGSFGPIGPIGPITTAAAPALFLPLAPIGVSDITITNNTISNNRDIGLFAEGENHGLITLAGNDFIDNPVGARFESGAIDLSDVTNPNSFINTNPLGLPIGMQFDGSPDQLTIVGETIGATTFEGFLNAGSFYVRFEDGSILDPVTGAPIVIDGVGATYDGINPALTGGALTPDILAFLEARIFDADDAAINGRGQLFVGFVPDAATLENIEDFFNTFGAFNGGGNGASVTIAGLPFINTPNNTGGTPNANFFANLEPAAGGESTDPNDLANLEPAAGGEESETSCWGDAVNAASNGQVASFSFGGSFENSIAQASAGCQSASAQ